MALHVEESMRNLRAVLWILGVVSLVSCTAKTQEAQDADSIEMRDIADSEQGDGETSDMLVDGGLDALFRRRTEYVISHS